MVLFIFTRLYISQNSKINLLISKWKEYNVLVFNSFKKNLSFLSFWTIYYNTVFVKHVLSF